MNAQFAQAAAALVAAATPWIVVRIALAVASRHARAHGMTVGTIRPVRDLGRATAAAVVAVTAIASVLPAPSAWFAVPALGAFAGLSILAHRALRDLDLATQAARYIDASTRTASLVARRPSHFLPSAWRAVLFACAAAGLSLFAWRIAQPSPIDRRLLVPAACALAAVAFLWLYESWIRGLATGPSVAPSSDTDRRRSIRLVFAAEAVLVVGFLALSHALLDVDWRAAGTWTTVMWFVGALLGVIGCALVVASDFVTRRYSAVRG